jgi:hypothetical protein
MGTRTVLFKKVGFSLGSGKMMRIQLDPDPQYWFIKYFIQRCCLGAVKYCVVFLSHPLQLNLCSNFKLLIKYMKLFVY